jgi:hypothetical protein
VSPGEHLDRSYQEVRCTQCGALLVEDGQLVHEALVTGEDGYAEVTFHPEVWHDGRAVAPDEPETFRVPLEDVTGEDGTIVEEKSGESDKLRMHPAAPPRAKRWSGPFFITIDNVVRAAEPAE